MMTETFINETYGINGITRISLKKIIEVFSFPNEINIKFSNKKKSINIKFIYDGLEVNYMLYFFSENVQCFFRQLEKAKRVVASHRLMSENHTFCPNIAHTRKRRNVSESNISGNTTCHITRSSTCHCKKQPQR